jgi:hypothetical protein
MPSATAVAFVVRRDAGAGPSIPEPTPSGRVADAIRRVAVDGIAHGPDAPGSPPSHRSRQLVLGLLFGIVFGFLLRKGGVAQFDVLIGALLLERL